VRVLNGLSRRRWLVAAGLMTVVAAAGITWFTTRDSTAAVQSTTATVSSGTFKTTVPASGTVEAAKQADLSFKVGGTVTSVPVSEGDKVHKGQVVATIGRASLRASLTAARASLTAAESQLDDDVDADESDTQLAADRAAVLSAKSAVESAESDLAHARLRSTIDGTVAAVDLTVGDEVSGGSSSGSGSSGGEAGATGGTPSTSTSTGSTSTGSTSGSAITVVSTKAYVVDATIASSDLNSVRKGMQAEITVTGLDETVYGTVSSIGLVAETSSSGAAEFPVEIAVTGSPKGLYAGTSADASIIVRQVSDVLTVPTQALHTSSGTTYVNKIVAGKPVRTTVVTGTAYGFQTQVKSGLKAGDTVQVATFTRLPGSGGSGQTGPSGGEGGLGGGDLPQGGFPQGGFPGGAAPGGAGGGPQ
jgi:multidrug efflux pump subunit AcrA (membrane-fusion protein)